MNIKEYIEGAKRTENKGYDAYMNLAENNSDIMFDLLMQVAGHGHAADKFKKSIIYGKPFKDVDGEVLPNDYVSSFFNMVWDDHYEDYVETAIEKISKLGTFEQQSESIRTRIKEPRIARLIHSMLGMITEQAEIGQAILKYIADPEAKDLDMVNVREEIGDSMWYGAIQLDCTDSDPEFIAKQNIEKLRLRFPEKFTEDLAINRDVEAERKLLEG